MTYWMLVNDYKRFPQHCGTYSRKHILIHADYI